MSRNDDAQASEGKAADGKSAVPNQPSDEIRGDKLLVTARKFNKPSLVRRTGNHKASEMVVEKDARATVLRAYTSTSN